MSRARSVGVLLRTLRANGTHLQKPYIILRIFVLFYLMQTSHSSPKKKNLLNCQLSEIIQLNISVAYDRECTQVLRHEIK